MERIQKAMEKLQSGKSSAQRVEPTLRAEPAHSEPQDGSDLDTVIFRTPAVPIDQALLERNRILLPGAPGPQGRPYKMLRTQVLQRMAQLGANTLAVLSPTSGAGKTLTAINLAIAVAAEEGRTALLIDFDLRNPSIHRQLGLNPEIGVEDCIEGQFAVRQAMVKLAGYDRLTVLPARRTIEASSELLADQRTSNVVAELRGRYPNRTLIFDIPPVLQADDALAFTRNVQAGLMVVREGHTQREDVQRSIELLRDLKIVGTVLNGSRNHLASGY
jgi:Mrp family chromosome partitioning ATPase